MNLLICLADTSINHPQDLCVTVVAGNFEANPSFGPLPDKTLKKVVDILPIDLPIELAGTVRHS